MDIGDIRQSSPWKLEGYVTLIVKGCADCNLEFCC